MRKLADGPVPDIHFPDLPHDPFALAAWGILGVVCLAIGIGFCLIKWAQYRQNSLDGNMAGLKADVGDMKHEQSKLVESHGRTAARVENIEKHVDEIRRDVQEIRRPRRWWL